MADLPTPKISREAQQLAPEIRGYELIRPIGSGGAGTVYKARNKETGAFVAIKCLQENIGDDDRRRWHKEVLHSTHLQHPHCVRTLGSGFSQQGHPFMVMELIEGGTLISVLPLLATSQNKSRYEMVVALCAQILDGLEHAHQRGIVHRDLKPSNILLKRADDWYVPKIADFGISIVAGTKRETATGHPWVGTPAYCSPEQADNLQIIDIRSDLYSFGVILYEMLSGSHPFDSNSIDELLESHRHKEAPPLPTHTPPQLAKIVYQLLRKNPQDRQISAKQVRDDLLHWQAVIHATNIPSLSLDPDAALDGASMLFEVLKTGKLSNAYKKYLLAIAEIAAEADVEGSDFMLGEMNAHPEIHDQTAAKKWYELAHAHGDTRAAYQLSLFENDENRKRELLECAAGGKSIEACLALASIAKTKGQTLEQIKWLTAAHELDSATGTLELAQAFFATGALTKAKNLFRQAYRNGDAQAEVRADFCELILRLITKPNDQWAINKAKQLLDAEGLSLREVNVAEGIESAVDPVGSAAVAEAPQSALPESHEDADPSDSPAEIMQEPSSIGVSEQAPASAIPASASPKRAPMWAAAKLRVKGIVGGSIALVLLAPLALLAEKFFSSVPVDSESRANVVNSLVSQQDIWAHRVSEAYGAHVKTLTCGNGHIGMFEACDGNNLNGASCEARGYVYGPITCSSDCRKIDESACVRDWWRTDFDSGNDLEGPEWRLDGDASWHVLGPDPEFGEVAESGRIRHGQMTSMRLRIHFVKDGTISFRHKTSSERGYDWLEFRVDGSMIVTGEKKKKRSQWSGDGDWSTEVYDVVAGVHEFSWTYSKDDSTGNVGKDRAWVDDIATVAGIPDAFPVDASP